MCGAVDVNISGVIVDVPIFVIEKSDHDLILRRPFERRGRISIENLKDGSYEVVVYSPNGQKRVTFSASIAQYLKNHREAAIFPTEIRRDSLNY